MNKLWLSILALVLMGCADGSKGNGLVEAYGAPGKFEADASIAPEDKLSTAACDPATGLDVRLMPGQTFAYTYSSERFGEPVNSYFRSEVLEEVNREQNYIIEKVTYRFVTPREATHVYRSKCEFTFGANASTQCHDVNSPGVKSSGDTAAVEDSYVGYQISQDSHFENQSEDGYFIFSDGRKVIAQQVAYTYTGTVMKVTYRRSDGTILNQEPIGPGKSVSLNIYSSQIPGTETYCSGKKRSIVMGSSLQGDDGKVYDSYREELTKVLF
jgi:hypothetical protein